MRKKIVVSFISLIVILTALNGQDYYYSNNRKININKADNWVVIQSFDDEKNEIVNAIRDQKGMKVKQKLRPERGIFWLEIDEGKEIFKL